MRVPWILCGGRGSGLELGTEAAGYGVAVDALVRLIDLAPTVLDLVGVAAPSSFEGALGGCDRAGPATPARTSRRWTRTSRATGRRSRGIVTRDRKLIDLPIRRALRSARGSARRRPTCSRATPSARGRWRRCCATDVARWRARGSAAEKTTLGAEARQRLQALGYVASSADAGVAHLHRRRRSEDADRAGQRSQRAVTAFNTRRARPTRWRAVRAIVRRIRASRPRTACWRRCSGRPATSRGAIATLEAWRAAASPISACWSCSPDTSQQAGNAARALQVLDAVIAAHPDDVDALQLARRDRDAARRPRSARARLPQGLELDPTSARAYANLAADELSARELHAGDRAISRARSISIRTSATRATTSRSRSTLPGGTPRRARRRAFVREAPPSRYAREIGQFRALLEQRYGVMGARPAGRGGTDEEGSRVIRSETSVPVIPSQKKPGQPMSLSVLLRASTYQINRQPTRAVRGARIAVGCWNAAPVDA